MSESPQQTILVPTEAREAMAAHSIACYPEEMCGLLVGKPATSEVVRFVPCTNIAHSAMVYTIDPKEHLRAELAAEAEGLEVIGCAHSHTHTEAYPSSTDIAQAPDPGWHYIIVSLKTGEPQPRSFRILGEDVHEESLILGLGLQFRLDLSGIALGNLGFHLRALFRGCEGDTCRLQM